MPYPPPEKYPLDDEIDVEGEAIEIDPIEIEGRMPEPERSGWLEALRIEGAPTKDEAVDMAGEALGIPWAGAAARGFADASTFGFADELAAGGEAALGGDYAETRDRLRDDMAESQADHPTAYAGGQLAGVGATLPILASPIVAAEGTGGRVGAALLEGGLLGAAGAAGDTEGDFASEEWAGDVVRGATAGGALGLAGGALGEGVRRAVPALRRAAARQLGQMAPRRNAARAAGADEIAAEAAVALDDVAEQMGDGIADVGRVTRRARQAAQRGMDGAEDLAPWLDEISAAAAAEAEGIGPRLARLGGTGRDGLAERAALRRARSGSPVNFGALESLRQRIAAALLEKPSQALSRLHDDLADALTSVAESQGLGRQYFDAVHAQQLAALSGRRQGPAQIARDALKGAAQGAAVEAGWDVARGETPDLPSTGALLGGVARAVGGSPRVRVGATRAAETALGGVGRAVDVGRRVGAGPMGQLAAGDGEPQPTASLAELEDVPNPETPTASLEELEDLDVPNPDVPTASLDDLDL